MVLFRFVLVPLMASRFDSLILPTTARLSKPFDLYGYFSQVPPLFPFPKTSISNNMGSVGPSAPTRLAILEADVPLPSVVERLGKFDAIFTSMFDAACKSLNPPQTLESQLTVTAYDVISGDTTTAYPDPEDIDAVLVTGSRYSAYADDEWVVRLMAFIRRLLLTDDRVRVIGVCFGHQIIARALGAEVVPSPLGWELSLTEMHLTEMGKAVFGVEKLVSNSVLFLKPPPKKKTVFPSRG